MALETFSRYPLNRPLSSEEKAARLVITEPATSRAEDDASIFAINETYLEVCAGTYSERGVGTAMFLAAGVLSLGLAYMFLWMVLHASEYSRDGGQISLMHWAGSAFVVFFLGGFAYCLRALFKDAFSYTYTPIRLNRLTKSVQVFRHNGPGGVVSVPWEQAFFFVERGQRSGVFAAVPCIVRCHILDEREYVVDSFTLGRRGYDIPGQSANSRKTVLEGVLANFEYYRRYMAGGISAVPAPTELLPTRVSFRNSLRFAFAGNLTALRTGSFIWLVLIAVGAIPNFLMGCCHFVATVTSRPPVWPEIPEAVSPKRETKAAGSL